MSTYPPNTKLTIISGYLRGRRCFFQVDVFDKVREWPYEVHPAGALSSIAARGLLSIATIIHPSPERLPAALRPVRNWSSR